MKSKVVLGLAAAVLLCTAAWAEEKDSEKGLESGIPVGSSVPAFQVVKAGGAPEDGIKVGQQLCYR
jgi:hypothetical protein